MFHPFLDTAILIFCYATLWFLLAQFKKDNSIVDIAWGLGFVVVAWWHHYFYQHQYSLVLCVLVSLWGIRLAIYLFSRNWYQEEDWRYQEMRRNWKTNIYWKAYTRVFLLQGIIMYLISLVIIQEVEPNQAMSWISYGGIVLFSLGLMWESIADYQLQQFKANADNKGKFMVKGLWKYSRHPNYFGEILVWWGIYLYMLPFGTSYFAIISPMIISFLLLKVSGIPFLQRKQKKNPRYQKYLEQVPNALLPKFW